MEYLPKPAVQALPAGFLGFLGIKNQGQNPSPLLDGVQSVMDLMRFYQLQSTPRGTDLITIPVGGLFTSSTFNVVPQGKCWLCTSISTRTAVMGATVGYDPFIMIVDGNGFIRKEWVWVRSGVTGVHTGTSVTEPFFMLPGWRVAGGHGGPAAANSYSWTYDMDVVEFQW
jgi:hypothetical protein